MKKILRRLAAVWTALILILPLAGCNGGVMMSLLGKIFGGKSAYTVGSDITADQITDFYFTYENINYNAHYQRYRFYKEGDTHFFFHETREKPGEYGWTSEADTTVTGTVELTEDEWQAFFAAIEGGTVEKREESDESGDAGPWMYLYWTGDKGDIQQYSFPSVSDRLAFETFCEEIRDAH